MSVHWVTGDSGTVTAALPAGSVDLILTSPPFLRLRDYLDAGDPAKQHEIGLEGTPAEFVDALLDCTEGWGRLLAPHGSIAVELGDTYSGSGGAGGDYNPGGRRDGQSKFEGSNHRRGRITDHDSGRRNPGPGWPQAKSLTLIPEAYRFALAYGYNPHNGRPTDPWRVRNVVRWVKPNPPVGELGDKFRPGTSEIVVACKTVNRWFDLDAVRTKNPRVAEAHKVTSRNATDGRVSGGDNNAEGDPKVQNPAGSPPLDWWEIPTKAYAGSHYAVYPPKLCIRPIEAMCPRRVCRTCGSPSRRILERPDEPDDGRTRHQDRLADSGGARHGDRVTTVTTTGWTTCGCVGTDGARLDGYHTGTGWRPGRVLDPFAGSGTTLEVASGHSRDAIGIDLDIRNAELARRRVGMWFAEVSVEELVADLLATETTHG